MLPGFAPSIGHFSGKRRFLFELGGANTANAVRGATHLAGENLAYIGLGYSKSGSSRTFSSFTWDGGAGNWTGSIVHNASGEHAGMSVSLLNVSAADYDKTMLMTMSGSATITHSFLRAIGGSGPVSHVASAFRAGGAFPLTHNLAVQKNDLVLIAASLRTSYSVDSDFAASGMTQMWEYATDTSRSQLWAALAPATGTFSTTLTSTNHTQQWVDGYIVLRPTL